MSGKDAFCTGILSNVTYQNEETRKEIHEELQKLQNYNSL
jgi:hypothetical protein